MKRFVVCDIKDGQDKDTKENLVFLTMYRIPSPMKDSGKLWHTKQSEAITVACAGANRNADDYKKYKAMQVGTIVDVTFGINDFTNKAVVARVDIFAEPNYGKSLF